MLNDIVPPRRLSAPPPSLTLMRSKRLQGHTPDNAKTRLVSSDDVNDSSNNTSADGTYQYLKHPHFFWRLPKKQRLIFSFAIVVGLALVISAVFIFLPSKTPIPAPLPAVAVQAEPPKPTMVASPLSGLQVAPELSKRPVTAVMVENSLDARPQSGLNDAGIVFEAIAEGGITRFMALFQDTTPQYIGPVRSLRPYYLDFATPFQASIAHAGGSPEALAQVRGGGYRDIDQFANSGAYYRSPGRAAPHNLYTSFERLDALNLAKGYTGSVFTPWARKEDQKLAAPTVNKIDIKISSTLYNVHYDYEAASNSYLRSEGGRPHISTTSAEDQGGQQIKPKVVITLVVPHSYSGKYSVYGIAGSGPMYVFQDGAVIQGNWTKSDRGSQFVFTDSAGAPLPLNAGQAWVTMAAKSTAVTYTP